MNTKTKEFLKKAFPKGLLYYRALKIIFNKNSYLHTTGWIRSSEENKPVDKDGNVIPWMNYSVIKFLKERLKNDIELFEFGTGYSTIFYASLVKHVTSVEYDESWFDLIKKTIPKNANLIYKTLDIDAEYCRAIKASGQKYDVVIVDGRDRVNCIKQSVDALSKRGVILLDDAEREKYLEGINYLVQKGFHVLAFDGLKPTSDENFRTTIFYREGNCFNI